MNRLTTLTTLFALALAPACAADEPQIGSETQASSSSNALSDNRLSYNRLSYNRLSYNGLDNDMHVDAEGREVLRYIAKCALSEGDTLVVESPEGTFEFAGLLGLAPQWEDGGIDVEAQETITACLLAHVNKFGVSVPISVRHPDLACPAGEEDRFTRFEGAFFGNIFDPEGAMFACSAGPRPDGADLSMGDRLLRVCADFACNAFVTIASDCTELCTLGEDGMYKDCATKWKRTSNTAVYSNPIQVWLLDAADEDAVWPKHINTIENYYGPADEPTAATTNKPNRL